MSIFGDIVNKLFHKAKADQPAPTGKAAAGATSATSAPNPSPAPVTASAALNDVDVAEVMDKAVADSGQTLNWRTSIVDMMKALGIDSSLEHRKQLAQELKYSGDTGDSATMNIWLHKQVMAALAANGGKLPPDLAS